MVAHILRLRAVLLLSALRADARERGRAIALLLAVAAGVVVVCIGVAAVGRVSAGAASVVTVLAGSAIALGCALAPPVAGTEEQLDPRRFAILGPAPTRLAPAILLASVISVPMIALAVVVAALGVMWAERGAGAASVLGACFSFLLCHLFVRVSSAVAALWLRPRRSRELTSLFMVALIVVFVPVAVFLASLDWGDQVPVQLASVATVLAYTPFGAPWAIFAFAAAGDGAQLWIAIGVATASIALLIVAWYALVDRLLRTIDRPRSGRAQGRMGWFTITPGTPTGAIAARSLTYWFRDRRYRANVLVVPVAALLATVPPLIAGVSPEIVALVPLPIMALLFGWLPHNDLAYDSTAVWMHFAGGVRGVSDRIGRIVPILVIGIPTFAICIPLAIAVNGRWAYLPALVGVCASLFLSGLGLASIASAAAPYAVSRPGDSPFQQPQRTGSAGVIAQALVIVGAIVLSAPTLWWAWLTIDEEPAWALAALVGGGVTGLAVLAVGLAVGAAVFERRSSALMEFAEASY